jgi:hypothetical protein
MSLLLPAKINIQATKTTNDIHLDGKLNEQVWQETDVFDNFKMVEPEAGLPPSEKTELRILYNHHTLYIGITCYTQDRSQITINDLSHDLGEREKGNDLVRILIDPFQDLRNAYVFFVTAGGARTDGLATGEHMTTNWDGIWNAKARVTDTGWTAEVAIPFKTINFNPLLSNWGLNIERYIPQKMETIRMSGISRDSFFYNAAEAGLLTGITGIRQGKGLTVKPYVSAYTTRDYEAGEERSQGVEVGMDIYKNFTPNLVGMLTYNTDFAETEVDERRINLTRFPLYFPEKRSFFLEGSEIFDFSSDLHRSFIPFYSRRIGLYDEDQVPIHYGGKIFGKIGSTNVALLDVRTRPFDELGGQNFFAGRVYQNILEESKVGLIFTSGDPSGEGSNQLAGADFTYNTSKFLGNKNFTASAWYVHNWNQIDSGSHHGYGVRAEYPNDLLDTSISYRYFGDALEPGMGFLPRNGIRMLETILLYKPRPKKGLIGRLVRQFKYELFSFFYWDLAGNLESSRIFFSPFNVRLESGEQLEVNFRFEQDNLSEAFDLSDDLIIPAGEYKHTRCKFQFRSASHRRLSADLEYTFGKYYDGTLNELEAGLDFKYNGHINISLEAIILRGEFPQGDFNKNLYRLKSDFFFNSDLGLMSYIQYDDVSRNLGANIRFKWRISPGNTIFLVYNRGWEKVWDPRERFLPLYDRGVFKIQLNWRP